MPTTRAKALAAKATPPTPESYFTKRFASALPVRQSQPRIKTTRSTRKRDYVELKDSDSESDSMSHRRRGKRRTYVDSEDELSESPNTSPEQDYDSLFQSTESSIVRRRLFDEPKEDSRAALKMKSFPKEIHQHIACYLSDKDTFSYAFTIRASYGALNNDSIWLERFKETFDFVQPKGLGEKEHQELLTKCSLYYKFRQHNTKTWVPFDNTLLNQVLHLGGTGLTSEKSKETREFYTLSLTGLLTESTGRHGKNVQFIREWLSGTGGKTRLDIMDAVFKTAEDSDTSIKAMRKYKMGDNNQRFGPAAIYTFSATQVVQLCLSPLALLPSMQSGTVHIANFEVSQYVAYATNHYCAAFLGVNREVPNIEVFLHIMNFFRYHLLMPGEGIVHHMYQSLAADQYPQPSAAKIQAGTQTLGNHWKGVHAFLNKKDLWKCRMNQGCDRGDDDIEAFLDNTDSNTDFYDISLFFDEQKFNAAKMPAGVQEWVTMNPFLDKASPSPFKNEVSPPEVKYCWGTKHLGRNAKDITRAHLYGATHTVASQRGIGGFQRIALVGYYTHVVNDIEVPNEYIWCFEGLVLPGGAAIVGRWYHPTTYDPAVANWAMAEGGPFLWWNVDRSDSARIIDPEDALTILEHFLPKAQGFHLS